MKHFLNYQLIFIYVVVLKGDSLKCDDNDDGFREEATPCSNQYRKQMMLEGHTPIPKVLPVFSGMEAYSYLLEQQNG